MGDRKVGGLNERVDGWVGEGKLELSVGVMEVGEMGRWEGREGKRGRRGG